MAGREKKTTGVDDSGLAAAEMEQMDSVVHESEAIEQEVVASAKSIPRPGTAMASPPKGQIGKVTVTLLGDLASAPILEEVEKVNKESTGTARTPLMTVIQGILAKNGGTMLLEDLAGQVGRVWNRTFPASPYNPQEFVYIMVQNSDSIRVSE
jgi:hypothetical protein